MTAPELWEKYTLENDIIGGTYEAWAFGGLPDELAELVTNGEKTATTSLYYWYENYNEPLPKIGDVSIILNSQNDAICIIQNTNVSILPFSNVTADQAYMEGEGDKSLEHWRNAHIKFFSDELKDEPVSFSENMEVVFEEFKVVYSL